VTDTGEALNENRYVNIDFNICQSISRLLHGRIWHDSEYHDGTRFIFEIPKTVTA
jgi:signal transduction histidine kinase